MLANNKVLRGRYRVVRPLRSNAAVYEAYDSERETDVALKEILIDLEKVSSISLREKIKHDFANQAKILAKVKHESLPQVRGYFTEIDRHYLIMELVDGTDVGELSAKSDEAKPLAEVMSWADQLLDALDYLHTCAPPVSHRDINPANVKLTSRGKIKLLGFNLANGTDTDLTVRNQNAALNYLSLEQIVRVADQASKKNLTDNFSSHLKKLLTQPNDAQSDIYALGATLYYLLTKQVPPDALARASEIWSDKSDPLATANQANPNVPLEISDVLVKAMQIERENRFETAVQMRQALQTAMKAAQERTAEETKKHEVAAAREAFLAEEKRLEQERQAVEQERQRIDAERKQQAELIERQLKEAEAQRIEAEKRAAEAEKRLSENEKTAQAMPVAKTFESDGSKKTSPSEKAPVFADPRSSFAAPSSDKKSSRTMIIAALLFLIVGGTTAGIWIMRSSTNAAESNKTAMEPKTTAETAAPETFAPPVAPPTVEKISETKTVSPAPVAPPVQTASKIKTAPPAAVAPPQKPVKPAAAPPAKAPANQKKSVTVDDLIGN